MTGARLLLRICLVSLAAGLVVPSMAGAVSQQAYVKSSNAGVQDIFGGDSMAIDGETMVIGASLEDSNTTGVNGNQTDNGAANSGAAYVFTRTGSTWSQQAYLKASNTEGDDRFGTSVAISGDTIVVGAPNEDSNATGIDGNQADNSASASGAAYVFTRTGTTWTQQAYLKASGTGAGDLFGTAVGVSGDTVVVGAHGEDSNATGVNGDQSDNSAFTSGAAYVFTRSGTTWAQQAYLKASNTAADDTFGRAVAIAGDTVVAGAPAEDSGATGINGNQADNGAPLSGAAYVFTRTGTTWSQQAYVKASNTEAADGFAGAVAISGDTLVAGALNEDSNAVGLGGNQANNGAGESGAAYAFSRSGTTWSQQAYLKASNTDAGDTFGRSVAVSGDRIVVGAPVERSNATGVNGDAVNDDSTASGAAYVFRRARGTWSHHVYLKASNTEAFDRFGFTVALSDDTVVAGAPFEDSSATGINGNQADNGASESGAAYVFANDPPTAVDDARTLAEDAAATTVNVLANDTDADGGERVIVSTTDGEHGAVAIIGGGTGVTYTPAADYCNDPGPAPVDTFTYTLNGGSTATVSVTVNCSDDPPTAVDDAATVSEDSTATPIDVLANDTDPDPAEISGPKRLQAKTDGAHGTVAFTGGGSQLAYKPAPDYCNEPGPDPVDTFTYTLNGGSTATVRITVACVEEPPPTAALSLGKPKLNKRKGTATLPATVSGPGRLEVAKSAKLKGASVPATGEGTVDLRLVPTRRTLRKLSAKGTAKVTAQVTFRPNGGDPITESVLVALKRR